MQCLRNHPGPKFPDLEKTDFRQQAQINFVLRDRALIVSDKNSIASDPAQPFNHILRITHTPAKKKELGRGRREREGKLVAVSLKAGDVRFLINQDDGAKGWDRVKGEGFSLYFTTPQGVDELAKRIKAGGGKLESEPADMPWGPRVFRVKDPDGFKLVFSS